MHFYHLTGALYFLLACDICIGYHPWHNAAKQQEGDGLANSAMLKERLQLLTSGSIKAENTFDWLFRDANAKSAKISDSKLKLRLQELEAVEGLICPSIEDPENGHVELSSDHTVGSTATFLCSSGFALVGQSSITCLNSLEWSGEIPICEKITCRPLEPPENGSVDVNTTEIGSTANFTCHSGFGLVGEAELNCLESGEWSDIEPNCSAINAEAWPEGTFAYPKPRTGCPEGFTHGCRFHDNEDQWNQNRFTNEFHLEGDFEENIRICYCVQNSSTHETGINWPAGRYCINRKGGSCPEPFQTGLIYWDDEDDANTNRIEGTMPDGFYNKDTLMFYCCRDDGEVTNEITLPTVNDFVLYQYRLPGCQKVKRMLSTEIIIEFDNEDWLNEDLCEGGPYNPGCTEDHIIFMCHYTTF